MATTINCECCGRMSRIDDDFCEHCEEHLDVEARLRAGHETTETDVLDDNDHDAIVAVDRAEDEPCERGTVGCSVAHGNVDSGCATW